MEPETIAAICSAIISFASACGSLYFSVKSAKARSKSHEVELAGWKQQYISELRAWADEVCNKLSEAIHLCDLDPGKTIEPDFFNRRHALLINLSALTDRGRWLFPNYKTSIYGQHKEIAYRGFRDPILDAVVEAYRLVDRMSYTDQQNNVEIRDDLVQAKRNFVASVQVVLDPWGANADFKRFIERMAELRETDVQE